MEVSKAFEADIKTIQNQLKNAILNHQVIVNKKNEDPTNIHIQVQLRDVQRHIISLGEIQKQLIHKLRKEIEANSTNSNLNNKTTHASAKKDTNVEVIEANSKKCASTVTNPSSSVTTKNSVVKHTDSENKIPNGVVRNNLVESPGNTTVKEIRSAGTVSPASSSSPSSSSSAASSSSSSSSSSPSSSSSSSSSEDEQDIQASLAAEVTHEKIAFLQAVGLITREILSDLQKRRVERKRRSTANHTQFVYGSNWDVSKRKKNGYLLSSPPQVKTRRKPPVQQRHHSQQKEKQQISRTENEKVIVPVSSTTEKVVTIHPSLASQACIAQPVAADKNNTSEVRISPKPISRSILRTTPVAPVGSFQKTSLRLASLPASLTIERVNSPPQVCIICGSSGMLSVCKNCTANFHPSCSKEASCCPRCNTDQWNNYVETKKGFNESPNGLIIKQTTIPLAGSDLTKRSPASLGRNYSNQDTADQ